MKITRTYPSICTSCGGTGIIRGIDLYITNTNICPVCNGAKTIMITETYDALYEIDCSKISPLTPIKINFPEAQDLSSLFEEAEKSNFKIPSLLKIRRKNHNLSLRTVSKKTGLSISTISRIENEKECEHSNYEKLLNFWRNYGKNESK